MSGERQEKVWVVMRYRLTGGRGKPAKVLDDREDARAYVKRMNRSTVFYYGYHGVKKG